MTCGVEFDPGKGAAAWLVKLKKVLKRALRERDGATAQIGLHVLVVSIGQILPSPPAPSVVSPPDATPAT